MKKFFVAITVKSSKGREASGTFPFECDKKDYKTVLEAYNMSKKELSKYWKVKESEIVVTQFNVIDLDY